jgi:uncharacterized membrane protein
VTATQTGIAVGAVLVIVLATFNFGWMVLVAVAMLIGALVGRIIDGKLDVSTLVDAVSGKRSSS